MNKISEAFSNKAESSFKDLNFVMSQIDLNSGDKFTIAKDKFVIIKNYDYEDPYILELTHCDNDVLEKICLNMKKFEAEFNKAISVSNADEILKDVEGRLFEDKTK